MNHLIVKCPSCHSKNKVAADKQHLKPKCGRCQTLLALQEVAVPVELSDQTADAFIGKAPLPILLDLYSPTCGPCRMLAPTIDSLARKFFGRIIVAKLDTSRNPAVAGRYRIHGVPTLLFLQNGQVVDQLVGAHPEAAIAGKITGLLSR